MYPESYMKQVWRGNSTCRLADYNGENGRDGGAEVLCGQSCFHRYARKTLASPAVPPLNCIYGMEAW